MKCNKQLSLAGINAFGTIAFGSESSSADLSSKHRLPFILALAGLEVTSEAV